MMKYCVMPRMDAQLYYYAKYSLHRKLKQSRNDTLKGLCAQWLNDSQQSQITNTTEIQPETTTHTNWFSAFFHRVQSLIIAFLSIFQKITIYSIIKECNYCS